MSVEEDLDEIKEDIRDNKVAIKDIAKKIEDVEAEIKDCNKRLEELTKNNDKYNDGKLADLRATRDQLFTRENNLRDKKKRLEEERIELQKQKTGYVNALQMERDNPHKRLKLEPLSIQENPKLYLENLNDEFDAKFGVQLQEYCFPIESLKALETMECGQTMDLNFLDPLRLPKKDERFLPSKIFIRRSMIDIFDLFRNDIEGERTKARKCQTVLLGAPGVGKSVLFFLAALIQAQKFYTVYLRKTQGAEEVSVFLMLPLDGSVRVWFTRDLFSSKLEKELISVQNTIQDFNKKHKGELKSEDLYFFVDGPNHNHVNDTLKGAYDYFCTSGGHPLPRPEQRTTFRMWILSGWTEPEAMDGLKAVYIKKEKSAALVSSGRTEGESMDGSQTDDEKEEESADSLYKRAYDLCGGSIRSMIEACDNYKSVKDDIKNLVSKLEPHEVKLALESTERPESRKSYDRILMMFRGNGRNRAIQAVDSRFALKELRTKLSIKIFLKGYTLASSLGDGLLKGQYFEHCIHQWFEATTPNPITSVCWSEGTTHGGIEQLTSPNTYWIPSISNFANVDSAVVIGNKLYVLQMTTMQGKKRNFDAKSLVKKFVTRVRESFTAVTLDEIVNVIFLVPLDSDMQFPAAHPSLSYTLHHVDMSGSSELTRTMKLLPFLDRA